MADSRNLVLQLLITARDEASSVFGKVFSYLDDNTKVVAGKVRDAFTGLFGGGLSGAMDFEAQLDRVAAKGGYTGSEMEDLKKKTALLGSQFGVTGTEAAQGMESLAAAGLSAKDAINALPPVLALAASEQISADAAAQKLIDSLSIMGLGFEDTARMADVLAKGANITTSSAAQLAEALTQAGGMARAAGMGLEETVAALDLLHKNGIKGSEAGTALKSILTSLIDPSSKASVELDKLGISSRDLGTVMTALKDKGGAANAAILAFGTEAGPGLRALLAEGQGALDDMTLQLQSADGAAQDAADQMGGNLKSALASLNSAWDSLKAALLEPLLQPITQAAKELTEAFQATLADGSIKGVQDLLREFGAGIADGIKAAIASFDFKAATGAINQFAESAKGSFAAVEGAAQATAGAIQVAFNLITAPIKAVVASSAQTVGNLFTLLSSIEAQAAKVGLGTLAKADELMAKAEAAKATAIEVMNDAKQDVDDLTAGANRAATAFDDVSEAMRKAREEAENAKPPELGNAETLTPIKKSLEDYVGILARAKSEQERANVAAAEAEAQWLELGIQYDAGKIGVENYNSALSLHQAAQKRAKEATQDVAQAQRDADTATQEAIRGIDKESTAITSGLVNKKARYDATAKQLGIDQQTAEEMVKLTNSLMVNAQAELALAKAKGDGNAIAEAQLKLVQNEITSLQAKKAEQEKELERIKAKADRMADLMSRQSVLNATEAAELELLKQQNPVIAAVVAAKETDIQTTSRQIEAKERERRQAEIMAGPIGQLTRLYAEQTQEHQRSAEASARYYSAQVQEAEGALKLAQIKGDAQGIDKAQAALDEQKIQQAQALANARATEAQDAVNALSAKKLELAADGELSKADQEQLANLAALVAAKQDAAAAAQQNADQMVAEAQAAREKAAADQAAADAARRAKEAAESKASAEKAASSVMSDALSLLRETGGELDVLSARFYELQGAVTAHAAGWDGWAAGTARAAQEVKQAYEDQRAAVTGMTDALDRFNTTGEYNASIQQVMIQASGDLGNQFDLLDQQSLDGLRSALDSANDKLREMQEITQSARDKLAALNADLLEAQGQDQKAELLRQQLDYQQQLAEIERQRQEAENAGNTEALSVLNQQRDVLEEINRIKTADIQATAQQTRTATSSASSSAAAASSAPTARYEIKLTAGAKTLTASTNSNPQSFLDELENAQRLSA